MEDRRPIAARGAGWAIRIARRLAEVGVHPNQISIFGVLISGIAATLLVLSGHADTSLRTGLLLGAAACIPIRAACNMFDGMVAVEFGRATKSGGLFNELPDRFSDALVLVGAGYAVPGVAGPEAMGWAAALLAVTTAYVRTLGASLGAGHDFSGVMAKQQRIAVMTLMFILSAFESVWGGQGEVVVMGLAVIIGGCTLTIIHRTARMIRRLGES